MTNDELEAARRLLAGLAHECLSCVLADDLRPDRQIVGVAVADSHGVQVVVFLAPWEGPPRLILRPGITLESLFAPTGETAGNSAGQPLPFPLRDVEVAALQAAPASTQRPVTVKRLASLAGYRDTDHFREAVRQLVDRGLLERVRGGVRKRSG